MLYALVSYLVVVRRGQRFAAAIGNLEARLEVAVDIHETPFVFPLFALFVVLNLPWLVKC